MGSRQEDESDLIEIKEPRPFAKAPGENQAGEKGRFRDHGGDGLFAWK